MKFKKISFKSVSDILSENEMKATRGGYDGVDGSGYGYFTVWGPSYNKRSICYFEGRRSNGVDYEGCTFDPEVADANAPEPYGHFECNTDFAIKRCTL